MQRVNLIGYVIEEPIEKVSKNGKAYKQLPLAVKLNKENTVFWTVMAFHQTQGDILKWIKKGSQCFITGSMMEPSYYLDREGNPKGRLSMIAEGVQLVGSREPQTEPSVPPSQIHKVMSEDDMNLPF